MSHSRDLVTLFRGNPDVVGMDMPDGSVRPARFEIPDTRERDWLVLADAHLAGRQCIGVYPYTHPHGQVAWGCVDLDEGEEASWSHATDLYQVLRAVGLIAWIERSRSKGYHVWVFALGWVPARSMRHLLIGACETAGVPSREVNPKQEWLKPGQLGNFVRLPYFGGGTSPPSRQVIVDLNGVPLSLPLFMLEAVANQAHPDQIEHGASRLWEPPKLPRLAAKIREQDEAWEHRLIPMAFMQLHEGPKTGSDRSTYLSAFAYACAESGLNHDEIKEAVRTADVWHCHKYCDRPDADERYEDLATRAVNAYA